MPAKRRPVVDLRDPLAFGASTALTVLVLLAVGYTLAIGKSVFVPIAVAFLLYFIASPVLRWMRSIGIPKTLGAALIVSMVVGAVSVGLWRLAVPAEEWIRELPRSLELVQEKLEGLRRPMAQVASTADQVDDLTTVPEPDGTKPLVVENREPSSVLADATGFLGQVVLVIFLLFLLLASADGFLRSLVRVLPRFRDKRIAVEVMRTIEREVSRYLITVSLINAGLGCAIGVAMALLGMPNPVLWGVMGGLLNFVPYAGAFVGTAVVAVVAILRFDSLFHALSIPAVYVCLTAIEGMAATPWILGRRLRMSPVAMLMSLLLWGWIWGIVGALVAVPLLVILKILCDHVQELAPISEFLAHEEAPPPHALAREVVKT